MSQFITVTSDELGPILLNRDAIESVRPDIRGGSRIGIRGAQYHYKVREQVSGIRELLR
ncbi:hypothetical protein [Mycolicibacterium houstonense]|uniref:hypothetical protein n=1 Tax=Mycolicibacterium houstonense TaxID=146021 RepID=UPI000A7504CF|nr:hypothetical protein [Mycolicibacterium houstonense]